MSVMEAVERLPKLVEARDEVYEQAVRASSNNTIAEAPSLPLLPVLLESRSETSSNLPLPFERLHDTLGNRAVVVHNVLSAAECASCIDFMNSADMVPAGSRTDYRNNLRIIVTAPTFAAEVYRRLLPILEHMQERVKHVTEDNRDAFPDNGIGMIGTWGATDLNPCFRMCMYHPGGHFAPHYDSDYIVDATSRRSFKTMMIYLSDDYDGGETNFVEEQALYWDATRSLYCSAPGSVIAQLKARPGDVLLFDHKILHEGAQVTRGQKFMMRSEIMYSREASAGGEEAALDPVLRSALTLLQQAKTAEGNREMDLAVKLYSKAFKLYPDLERYA